MKVCVIGGQGFVGSAVATELRQRDHDTTTMDPGKGSDDHISLSILDENLQDHLHDFDAVVNMVGLSPMKQPGTPGYYDLHVSGAENVVLACKTAGVETLVHMSALGADPNAKMEFLATKGRGEEIVLDANMRETTVFRPSLIFDHGNELIRYASLFAPFRVFPQIPARMQPIYRRDVASLFADAVEGSITEQVCEIGGPEKMSLFEFVRHIYNARGYTCYRLPVLPLMRFGLNVLEYVPFSPFGKEQARFLAFDNTTNENRASDYISLTAVTDWCQEAF